jgi:hypothetical protein
MAAVSAEGKVHRFPCVWCQGMIEVPDSAIGCGIFRHAILRDTGQPINPHTPQQECERLVQLNLVRGCCQPFRFFLDTSGAPRVERCAYI